LALGKYPVNGMDGVLVRRSLMEKVHWFQGHIMPDSIFSMNLWILMLQQILDHEQGMIMGAFPSKEMQIREYSADEYIAHQINWFYLLSANQEKLNDEELRAALRNQMDNSRVAACHAQEVSPELLEEYWKMMYRMCNDA
ncbi:MAG: hypothetical protein II178_01910, partial [Selenomonadaceae bacterium]|nr:hypothetical protein [Selenomonadaceae bacterium]